MLQNKQVILGISLSHNSSASFVNMNNEILYASSQERTSSEYINFNYIKNQKYFPIGVIRDAVNSKSVDVDDIKVVVWTSYELADVYNFVNRILTSKMVANIKIDQDIISIIKHIKLIKNNVELNKFREENSIKFQEKIINTLISNLLYSLFNIKPDIVTRVNHHLSHAYGTLKTSGFSDSSIVICLDGFGDGISGSVYKVENNKLRIVNKHTIKTIGSPCLMYQYLTGYIRLANNQRLTMLRDEYKLLGLEVYSENNKYNFFNKFIYNYITNDRNTVIWKIPIQSDNTANCNLHNPVEGLNTLLKVQKIFDKELLEAYKDGLNEFDIARAGIKRFEEVVLKWIKTILKDFSFVNLALGGGGFYNVKLNYKIKELKNVNNLWIYPACGDEGNSLGAAFLYIAEKHYAKTNKINTLYIGKKYSKSEILDGIKYVEKRFSIKLYYEELSYTKKMEYTINLLRNRKIIHLANTDLGAEFGPRALGVRSTLSYASSNEVAKKINNLFGRFKYMPLAPVIRYENAKKVFHNYHEKDIDISKYMIITYPCCNSFANTYPAVVHPYHKEDVKNENMLYSSRPQVVTKSSNFMLWDILKSYEMITGEFVLVNTSFNSHNSPILGEPHHILIDWLSMTGESHLFLGNYYFNYYRNIVDEIIKIKWKRAKKLRNLMYLRNKKQYFN